MKKILLTSSLILLAGWAAWAQSCPNGDFENWNIYPYSVPDSGWFNSNPQSVAKADSLTVWPVTGVVGQAVHIQTAIIGTDTLQAYVINTLGDPKTGTGGMPYSQQPTSINGYYRYHMVGADSALMIIEFKKAGSVIATTQFAYRNASGDITTFTPFSFPLATIPVVPDSVIIGLASSNLEGTGVQMIFFRVESSLFFFGQKISVVPLILHLSMSPIAEDIKWGGSLKRIHLESSLYRLHVHAPISCVGRIVAASVIDHRFDR